MAQRTDADLLIEANVIRDETAVGANTALRVGLMLDNLIDSKVNNDNVSNNTGLGGSTPSPTVVPSQNAVKTYVDTLVVGYLNDRGNYDPTITSLYPTTGGSGAGGVIEKGDLFFISADGTMNTIPVLTGYTVRALASAPGQTDGNWSISNIGIGYIPENSASRSTDPTMGSPTPSNVLYPSQLAVRDFVDTQILAAVPYTPEAVANKVPSDITLDPTSTTLYPSNAAVVNFVTANIGVAKPEYRARMFQSATGDPSDQATYIDSITVGTPFVSPTWRFITLSRVSAGTYTLTITYDLVQVIIGNRAEISFSDNKITNGAYAQGSTGTSQSLTFTFYRYDSSGTLVDGINWTNVYLKLW